MVINEYDLVLIRDGREARIVDVTAQGVVYEADVGNSPQNWETITIHQEDIVQVIKHAK